MLFSVIQVGIAEPELANSSLEVLAFEVIKPRPRGFGLKPGLTSTVRD